MFEWITETMSAGGYWGIAFLMLIENVFPPIPSEVIMPLGGFLAHQGKLTMTGVIVAGSLGSLLGTTLQPPSTRQLRSFFRSSHRH